MRSILYTFALFFLPVSSIFSQQQFAGHWNGKLNVGAKALAIVFNVTASGDTLTATLDSPDQGAMGINVRSVSVAGDSIFFDIKIIGASYAAKYIAEGDSARLTGKFKQSAYSFDLTCTRSEKAFTLNRPQEPKPPFPYFGEEVEFENKTAGVKFSGTFTRPKEGKRFASVILVTGSGPQDRDESLFGHKPLAVIADHLTKNGFAVLRYDERGVGKSTGNYSEATTMDFTLDAIEAVKYLKSRSDVDSSRTGIIGHSEGGVVAPMAAAMFPGVNFIVMLAGLGVPGDELMLMQYRAVMESESAPESKIEKQLIFNRELFEIVKSETDSAKFFAAADDLIAEFQKVLTPEEKEIPDFKPETLRNMLKIVNTKWFRYFINTDPKEYLAKVRAPVLALNGTKDIQVPYRENLAAIEKSLKAAGNKNYKTVPLEGLNHLFQKCGKCSIEEYGKLEETFNEAALKEISGWMAGITK